MFFSIPVNSILLTFYIIHNLYIEEKSLCYITKNLKKYSDYIWRDGGGDVWLLSPLISLNGNVCFVLKLVTWNRNIFELKCFTTNDDDDDIDNDDVCVPCCSFSKRNVIQVRLQKYDCAKLQLSNIISKKRDFKRLVWLNLFSFNLVC